MGCFLIFCGLIIETKVSNLEKDSSNALTKFDAINKALKENNEILTEVKVKLEMIFDKGEKNDTKRYKKS